MSDPREVKSFDNTIGANLVCFALSLFLYGITTGQVVVCWVQYGWVLSTIWGRGYVLALWATDTAHAALLVRSIYYYTIYMRGNPAAASTITWSFSAILVVAECNTLLVRVGYAYMIWRFNHKRIAIPIVIATLSAGVIVVGCVFGAVIVKNKALVLAELRNSLRIAYALFCCEIAADTVIAVTMIKSCHKMYTGLNSFDTIIRSVIVYVVITGLMSLIFTTACLITLVLLSDTSIAVSLYWVLSKLHTCSLLAVLNAEKDLADRMDAHIRGNAGILTTALSVTGSHTTIYPLTPVETHHLLQDATSARSPSVVEEPSKFCGSVQDIGL